MRSHIGEIAALYRYPVKSMRGDTLEAADLGWHGIDGDRRFALRRAGDHSGFPWLTASKLRELILFTPERHAPAGAADAPTHVRTPDGRTFPLASDELAADIGQRHGTPVELLHLKHGAFDDASVSVITSASVDEIGRLAAVPPDPRRFRPNLVIATSHARPFQEDAWLGGVLTFGQGPDAASVHITHPDERCAMVNLDPDSAQSSPEVLKAIVRAHGNMAGVYGSVTRCGRLTVGQPVFFEPA